MNNLEIEQMIKDLKIKNFIGVFMRDQIPNISDPLFYFIYNTQCSFENGAHWITFCKINKKYYHYCPYGSDPSKEIIDKYNPVLSSTFRFQNFDEKSCGLYCILLIYLLDKGNSFEDSVLELLKYR